MLEALGDAELGVEEFVTHLGELVESFELLVELD